MDLKTDRYRRLTRAILMPRVAASMTVIVVLERWIVPYRITNAILINNGSQFESKIFAVLLRLARN